MKLATGNLGAASAAGGSGSGSSSGIGGGSTTVVQSVNRLVRYQSYRTRTETDIECQKLFRMIVMAYYSSKHHHEMEIVVDGLLACDVHSDHQVLEEKISDCVRLPMKRVGGLLASLGRDHLIQPQQMQEQLTEEEALKRKRQKFRRGTERRSWYIDYDLLLKVLKYRHEMISASLTKAVDKSEMFFVCPNRNCENRPRGAKEGKKWSLIDLLAERQYSARAPPVPVSDTSGFFEPTAAATNSDNDFLCPAAHWYYLPLHTATELYDM